MSAHVLISGALFRAPEERTGKTSGKSFVAATIKVRDGGAAQFLRALAFSAEAQNELLRLDDGDSSASDGRSSRQSLRRASPALLRLPSACSASRQTLRLAGTRL